MTYKRIFSNNWVNFEQNSWFIILPTIIIFTNYCNIAIEWLFWSFTISFNNWREND